MGAESTRIKLSLLLFTGLVREAMSLTGGYQMRLLEGRMTKISARTIRTLCLIVGCSFFLSEKAHANTVIVGDFGTGNSYDCCTAYGLNTLAVSFTPTDNVAVSQIDLAIYYL